MNDYLIVVDANFPSGALLTLETARRISPRPGWVAHSGKAKPGRRLNPR
jgi:hypothetical protein